MTGGKILDQIEIGLRNKQTDEVIKVYVDAYESSLARKWLNSLNDLLNGQYHLEKNYCFFGFVDYARNGEFILDQVNKTIEHINNAGLGYTIDDHFTMANCITNDDMDGHVHGRNLVHDKLNWLHRYFEELQGASGRMSPFYNKADPTTRWHIRQLNLLCHEFESWALSYRKQAEAPEWQRPSQIMCWLNAPRFRLDPEDYELFGVDTIGRPLGGVFVGVNKAIGKHHWEVFRDEGRDSRIDELTTKEMNSQTEAAGDFDIEWGRDPATYDWMQRELQDFRHWLRNNGFDPEDKSLTIGHPQVGQVDLKRSFGTEDYLNIWSQLNKHLDVYTIKTSNAQATFDYHWSDPDFVQRQVSIISKGH